MMALLFARDVKYIYSCILSDNRDLEEVIAAVRKTLNSFIIEFKFPDKSSPTSVVGTQSRATHLVYRFLGLFKFRSAVVDVPENTTWLFLYLHQLMYEKTAIAYPTESGIHGQTKQQIQRAVNRDINGLCNAKFRAGTLSKNDKANNKYPSPPSAADLSQKSMSFFLKLCSYVASKLSESDGGTVKDRLCLGALFASQVFTEVATRNEGFGEFGTIGSLHVKVQDYFLALWDAIEENMPHFSSALSVYHPGITDETTRPYMMKTKYPNIFSFIHLTFQSLQHDFVSLFHVE
jgi:hypothetical protein